MIIIIYIYYCDFPDSDECALRVDHCDNNAACSNLIGGLSSYQCQCKPDYSGNGTSCTSVGEYVVVFFCGKIFVRFTFMPRITMTQFINTPRPAQFSSTNASKALTCANRTVQTQGTPIIAPVEVDTSFFPRESAQVTYS